MMDKKYGIYVLYMIVFSVLKKETEITCIQTWMDPEGGTLQTELKVEQKN